MGLPQTTDPQRGQGPKEGRAPEVKGFVDTWRYPL